MSYQVLYRKYRPKDFSEVVGQDHIVSVIRRQIEAGRVAHAYLFSGPRGVGKTTIARLIAKSVNCANTPSDFEKSDAGALSILPKLQRSGGGLPVPCNECVSCQTFNAGQALNLIEIDAASNRGIDDIREIRQAVRYVAPTGGRKVYIIDEVHQLSKEAFNALLKTLEEPPSHVIFVLATTELDRVPATIVSRTQSFDFRRPRESVIKDRLLRISEREGVLLHPEAAATIAFIAEGSLRDAESMLGKILAVEDKEITAEVAEEILGVPPRSAVSLLFDHIASRELAPAIELLNRMYHDGYEMEYMTKMLISYFRDALLKKTDPSFDSSESALPESAAFGERLAAYGNHDLADAIVLLIEALASGRRSPIPQLPLELAIIQIIGGDKPAFDQARAKESRS